MSEMKCKRCGASENRIYGFCSIECRTAWEYEDDIRDLTARIAELEAERRWIPASERLPDNWKSVLTIDISKSTRDMVTAFYDPETSLWSTHLPNYDLWVTHWMPLPEPPIVYGKECE